MLRFISLLALVMLLVACSTGNNITLTPEDLPDGDAQRGAALFAQSVNGAPPCSACHTTDGTAAVGPSLLDFGQRVATTEYALYSIVQPAQHITEGYSNVMYSQYGGRLSPQDIADLVAFLLSQ
jgi:mono/diheme cytochrome c family protein